MVLEHEADVYVMASRGTKKWDTCAPEALLRAAGGYLTDIHGHTYGYTAADPRGNDNGVLAGLTGLSQYLAALRDLPAVSKI
jgi:3'(2'), 5'-bisphosphate nucleotidase